MKDFVYKNIYMSSFKSSENSQKKDSGLDRSVSDNQSSSVILNFSNYEYVLLFRASSYISSRKHLLVRNKHF